MLLNSVKGLWNISGRIAQSQSAANFNIGRAPILQYIAKWGSGGRCVGFG
jgi:hypothetical protein